jgi:uncharacterized membrane protein YbhN (UPF0104 family)
MWRILLKAVVSIALIYLLLRGLDGGVLLRHMLTVDRAALFAAVLTVLALSVPSAVRWSLILDTMGARLAFAPSLQLVMIGLFFNLVLPSSVGGDAVRAWKGRQLGIPLTSSIISVIVDRLVGLLVVAAAVIAGLPALYSSHLDETAWRAILMALAAGCLGFVCILALDQLPLRLHRFRAFDKLAQVSSVFRKTITSFKIAPPVLLLSVVNLAGAVLATLLLARGLGLPIGWLACSIVVSLASLVSVIPVSIAGWGLREGAFVVGFGAFGLPVSDALSLSMLFGVTVTVANLPGGIVWLATDDRRRERSAGDGASGAEEPVPGRGELG